MILQLHLHNVVINQNDQFIPDRINLAQVNTLTAIIKVIKIKSTYDSHLI